MTRRSRLLLAAVVVNGTVSVIAWLMFWLAMPAFDGPVGTDRLVHAAGLAGWIGAVVLGMVFAVAAGRGRDLAFNPIDDPESRSFRVLQRALANTVEQSIAFLPLFFAFAMTLPDQRLGLTTLVVWAFVVGRALFFLGYLIHPYVRAPGMAITLNVNAGLVVYLVFQSVG